MSMCQADSISFTRMLTSGANECKEMSKALCSYCSQQTDANQPHPPLPLPQELRLF